MLFKTNLKYWKDESEYKKRKHPKGIIDFDKVMVQIILNKVNYFDLHLLGCERIFQLKV